MGPKASSPVAGLAAGLMALAAALAAATASAAITAAGPPYLLHVGTWVCSTPEAYDQALTEQARTNGRKELMALKARLLAEKLCMLVDDDHLEDMMAPFVEVIEQQNDKVKVTFTIEFYKRVDENAAGFRRVKYAGWTAEDRLADFRPIGD
jgi:hypothetical protein